MATLYRPSGRVSPRTLPATVLILVPAAMTGAMLGGFAAFFPVGPSVKLLLVWVLAPALLSLGLGWLNNRILRLGHVRNVWVGRLVALLAGLVAAYVASAAFLYSVLAAENAPVGPLDALDPRVLAAPSIVFSAGGEPFSPLVLLCTAVLFAGLGWLLASGATSAPYCESCARWVDDFEAVAFWVPHRALEQLVEDWDVDGLAELPEGTDDHPRLDVMEAAVCPECGAFATVRVKQVSFTETGRMTSFRMEPHVVAASEVARLRERLPDPRGT